MKQVYTLRTRLEHYNSYYNIIKISITNITRIWDDITIPIHLFGDNTVMKAYIYVKILECH